MTPILAVPVQKAIIPHAAFRLVIASAHGLHERDSVEALLLFQIHFQAAQGLCLIQVPARSEVAIVCCRSERDVSVWLRIESKLRNPGGLGGSTKTEAHTLRTGRLYPVHHRCRRVADKHFMPLSSHPRFDAIGSDAGIWSVIAQIGRLDDGYSVEFGWRLQINLDPARCLPIIPLPVGLRIIVIREVRPVRISNTAGIRRSREGEVRREYLL